jgi:hypothetical protein
MQRKLRDALARAKRKSVAKIKTARPFERFTRTKAPKSARMIAYDFETTSIRAGTPRPLYLTAYSADARCNCYIETSVTDFSMLQRYIVNNFLTDEYRGCKFVAWAGNNYDAYFIAVAIVTCPDFVIRPYLTRNNSLRGLKILRAEDANKEKAIGWEFLDGMAMLGLVGVSLAKFLATYAPELPKLSGVIDFEREEFDPKNVRHCEYAMRDSVGLWHAMNRAQVILMDHFDEPLAVTMGGVCIKIFRANIPDGIRCWAPSLKLDRIVRGYVMRGGYCYCVKRYQGPVWKYDLNQAYAAAMRDARLPAGEAIHQLGGINRHARTYIARIEAHKPGNTVPFYYRTKRDGRMRSLFALEKIEETWITDIELRQLQKEAWAVTVHESYAWETGFSMLDYVNDLESLRTTCEGGPAGPIGSMVKAVGNHSFGKLAETIDPIELVLAPIAPLGYAPYYPEGDTDPMQHVYYRTLDDDEVELKDYHQPQIAAFITAHVRMLVRRAALLASDAWLYADTDCVVFARDVTAQLDIDGKRYGAWKVEDAGTNYQIIAKKVYAQFEGVSPAAFVGPPNPKHKRSSKGLNVKKLSPQDFDDWFNGAPPAQDQIQRNNFLKVMQGAEMFRAQTRHGTAVESTR